MKHLLWRKLKGQSNPAFVICALIGFVTLFVTACNGSVEENYQAEEYQRCDCGGWYLYELARTPTPPLNFIEIWERTHNFLYQFDTVHQFTFWEWHQEQPYPTTKDYVYDWEHAFILFPDQTLRDFRLLWLGLDDDGDEMNFYIREVLFEIDRFTTSQALALNLQLAHYLIPGIGFEFATENNQLSRFLLHDGTARGGCGPHFSISPHDQTHWAGWID